MALSGIRRTLKAQGGSTNQDGIILLASSSQTTTQTLAGPTNDSWNGIHLIIDVTNVAAGPSITPKIQGLDPVSGKWYDVLVGTAITATGTNVLKIFPGAVPQANAVANDFLPRQWQVVITANNANAGTYSVGALLTKV